MKMLVTGSTGLVGSHSVAALQAAGHEVRVLVRNPQRLSAALDPLGAGDVEVVRGDVTDLQSVRTALSGCDAVVHAAALYSLDATRADEIHRTNVRGTGHVVRQAVKLGLDPVIHVSSLSALLPAETPRVERDARIAAPHGAYGRSKAEAERIVRELQDAGAPVVTFYPGAIWAPNDPSVGEGIEATFDMLRSRAFPSTPSGMVMIDARDLAAAIAAAVEPGRGPRRFLAGGNWLSADQLTDTLEELTGRTFWRYPAPAALLRTIGLAGDLAGQLGRPIPMTSEAVKTMLSMIPTDDSALAEELGVALRPARETLADTLRWAFETGRLGSADVGRLALQSRADALAVAAQRQGLSSPHPA